MPTVLIVESPKHHARTKAWLAEQIDHDEVVAVFAGSIEDAVLAIVDEWEHPIFYDSVLCLNDALGEEVRDFMGMNPELLRRAREWRFTAEASLAEWHNLGLRSH